MAAPAAPVVSTQAVSAPVAIPAPAAPLPPAQVAASPDALGSSPSGRCFACNKKTGLTGFKCRCGQSFCGSHRYADAHACSFDYKAAAAQQLAKANPVVAASKIDKARTPAQADEVSLRPRFGHDTGHQRPAPPGARASAPPRARYALAHLARRAGGRRAAPGCRTGGSMPSKGCPRGLHELWTALRAASDPRAHSRPLSIPQF